MSSETSAEQPTKSKSMYLSALHLSGFRSCAQLTINFQPTLTLLVGENNAGKSNIIDALRLLTLPLSGRRTRYFEIGDRSRGTSGPIELTGTFRGLTEFQEGQYIGALDVKTSEVQYTTVYHLPDDDNRRGRFEQLAGLTRSADTEPEKRDQINHVYLAPLRDAQRELDSGSGTRLGLIMEHLVGKEDKEAFLEKAKSDLRELSGHTAVTSTSDSIQEHMSGLTAAVREQTVGLAFEEPEMFRLARSLRLKMAEHGVDLSDLNDSGLGYANLLYLSTVVLELQKARDSELTLFLVEEPEAHLHPQLQSVLLDYLEDQANASVRDDSDAPAGRIQVIATTHSPNLASSVGTSNIVVLRSVESEQVEGDGAVKIARKETKAIELAKVPLHPDDRRKIDQYLDVTRSELLFTQRMILVEGLGEAVLVPALARFCVFPETGDDETLLRRKLAGTSVISIGSVDFSPYLTLLLTQVGGVRLAETLVVITDGDPPIKADDDEPEPEEKIYNRADSLRALGDALGAKDNLYVAEAKFTLEADLLGAAKVNEELTEEAYLKQHPNSKAHWTALTAADDPALALYTKLRQSKRFFAKGQFAHDVAILLASGKTAVCPEYLRLAILRVVGGSE